MLPPPSIPPAQAVSPAGGAGARPYVPLERSAKRAVLLGAAAMHFYNLLYAFTMPVVLPTLLARYGMMERYALLGGLNSLLACIIAPIGGKLGDRFGRRRVGLAASAVRLALMVGCAVPTVGGIFFALYLSGNLVGGLLGAFPLTILSDVTTQAERPRLFGLFGAINGVALLAGLLGGGLIVDLLGPLATFLFFAPFGLLSIVPLALFFPNHTVPSGGAGLDKRGMLLLRAGLGCVLTWCNFGGEAFGRLSPLGLSLLAAGAGLIALLLWYEPRAASPLLDPRLFRNRNFLLSFLTHMLIAPMVCLCSGTLALYGQVGLGLSATVSGTLALPKNILFFLLPAFLGAWIAKDQRRFRGIFLLCGGAIALASFLCSLWDTETSLWTIYAVMLLFGVGTSCQSVCIQPYMQMAVDARDMGSAVAMVQFANSIGIVVFTSVYSILYSARYLAAMQPGGRGAAFAVAETFSGVALLSVLAGLGICAATLLLIPRRARGAAGV